jgi:hypothetical protein
MFDWVSSIYSEYGSFLNGVFTTLGFLGTPFGAYQIIKSRQKKVFYQWVRSQKAANPTIPGYSQSISFEGNVGKTLITDVIVISNRTDVTLTDEDFVKPISIQKNPDKKIYQCMIVDTGNGASASLQHMEASIQISNLHIPRSSSLTLFIAHDEAIIKILHATTKSIPDLQQKTFKKAYENILVSSSLFVVSSSVLLISGLLVLNWFTENDTQIYFRVPIVLSWLIIYGFFSYFVNNVLPKSINSILRPIFGLTIDEDRLAEKYVMAYVESEIFGTNGTVPK